MRKFLLIVLLYPFLEIAALVTLAGHFGALAVLLYVCASALFGCWMLRNQKLAALLTLGSIMRQGEAISVYSLLWPLRYTLSGILFIIPGVLSEIAAIALLLPLKGPQRRARPVQDNDVIEGEYHHVNDDHDRVR
ncbi:FxsA family protein [Paludibacterium yongneupense]|uniref:FxsA family protein n=1 Tax=Paludibacterium yongneupense TaxID=400061 RepID=UPI0003FB0F06|nr:FxsA family protein [Paludibacterium yongneupense]